MAWCSVKEKAQGQLHTFTHWFESWVCPKADVNAMAKRKVSCNIGNRTPVIYTEPVTLLIVISRHGADIETSGTVK
jgi:hypothetical protein